MDVFDFTGAQIYVLKSRHSRAFSKNTRTCRQSINSLFMFFEIYAFAPTCNDQVFAFLSFLIRLFTAIRKSR